MYVNKMASVVVKNKNSRMRLYSKCGEFFALCCVKCSQPQQTHAVWFVAGMSADGFWREGGGASDMLFMLLLSHRIQSIRLYGILFFLGWKPGVRKSSCTTLFHGTQQTALSFGLTNTHSVSERQEEPTPRMGRQSITVTCLLLITI